MHVTTTVSATSITVGTHYNNGRQFVLLYFGESGGSAMLTQAEAAELRNDLSAILPASHGAIAVDLVHAVRRERDARAEYNSARDTFDRQRSHGLLSARIAETDRIAAIVLDGAAQLKQAAA
ncbi:MAG TPA: hypothetical protein PKO41_04185 [Dokdonella sp.]|nr:hypothetical protein [Dokdonella sp.]